VSRRRRLNTDLLLLLRDENCVSITAYAGARFGGLSSRSNRISRRRKSYCLELVSSRQAACVSDVFQTVSGGALLLTFVARVSLISIDLADARRLTWFQSRIHYVELNSFLRTLTTWHYPPPHPLPPQLIDILYSPGPQQQTHRTLL